MIVVTKPPLYGHRRNTETQIKKCILAPLPADVVDVRGFN